MAQSRSQSPTAGQRFRVEDVNVVSGPQRALWRIGQVTSGRVRTKIAVASGTSMESQGATARGGGSTGPDGFFAAQEAGRGGLSRDWTGLRYKGNGLKL